MPRTSSSTPEYQELYKKLEIKYKNLQKKQQQSQSGVNFWKAKHDLVKKDLDKRKDALLEKEQEWEKERDILLLDKCNLKRQILSLNEELDFQEEEWKDISKDYYQFSQGQIKELSISLTEKEEQIKELEKRLSNKKRKLEQSQEENQELKEKINNHECSEVNCSHADWAFESDIHVCQTVCSHTDYDQIKQERDQLQTKNTELEQEKLQAIQAKETEIIGKIITDLQLTTKKEQQNALELVITELKSKLNKDPDNSVDKQIVRELATQTCSHKPTAEIIKKVSRHIKDIKKCVSTRLEGANTYSQLFDIKSEEVKNKLAYEIKQKCYFKKLTISLGALSAGSLLVLVILMIKMVKSRKNNKN